MSISLAADSRLQHLSPKAREFLERILEAFPHDDLFGSGVPAAPAQLRLTLYRSDDTRLDSQIGRQLKELELNSILILRRTSRKTRSLKLTLDFSGAPKGPLRTLLPNADCNSVIPVIHNPAGLSPPIDQKKIAVVAATAVSSFDLVEKLQPYFPRHDVSLEFKRYFAHREEIGKPAVVSAFVKWMLRAEVPLAKLVASRRGSRTVNRESEKREEQQLNLFDEAEHRRFIEQMNERKTRIKTSPGVSR